MPIGSRLIAVVTMVLGTMLIVLGAIGVVIFPEWIMRVASLGVAVVGIGAFIYAEEILEVRV